MFTMIAVSPRGRARGLILLGAALLGAAVSAAAGAANNRLQSIETAARGNDAVIVRLTLAGAAPNPSVFTVDDPARLSIDLPSTALGASVQRYQPVDQGPVKAITTAATERRTRVVIELAAMTAYDIDRRGHQLVVHLGPRAEAPRARPREDSALAADASAPRRARAIDNIDFRRGAHGAGRVDIALDGRNARVDVSKQNGRVIARLPGIRLPARLRKRLDVVDFATPVQTIDAQARNDGAVITVRPIAGADYEQLAYQTGRHFYIELQPVEASADADEPAGAKSFAGKKISLSFQNVDVRKVLQIIADVARVNMVVADSVSGQMALQLQNVPWDQALDIIMNAKGLGMERADNVITVAPLAEIAARKKAQQVARQAAQDLAPLHSEIIQINYARAADIATLLRSAGGDQSLLSTRGQVTVDERTNSLLVDETRAKLADIHALIDKLDIPVRQVLIQARIVVANRSFSRDLGVSSSVNDEGAFESPKGGNYISNSGFSVDLPVANPAGTLATSIIGDTFSLNLALSALESENRGEIISSPRVITANGQQARIEQGQEIPYLEAASSGAATVSFKKAVLSLTVIPQITPDQRVIMNLAVTQDQPNYSAGILPGSGEPPIDTRQINTQVLVKDGETVVLGGIYEQQNQNTNNRVPFLGKIPLIGALFRGTEHTRSKRELLLFITPKILHDAMTRR